MKAVVFQGVNRVEVKNVNDPTIEKADDIIVKITSASICGSDLHLIHGMIPKLRIGSTLGHEAMGIVVDAGREVTKVNKGDRVVIPFSISCGHCWFCQHGLSSLCDNSNGNGETSGVFGYSDLFGGYDGGQAEYLRVPYANVGPVKVPDELRDEEALFLTDILPTAYWSVVNSGMRPGDTVVILGCGPVGLLTAKWAAFMGAGRIICADCVGYRLEHAGTYGMETANIEDHGDAGRYLKEITHGGADVVIDCVGMEGKMSAVEKAETILRLQGGSKSAIEIAAQAVRKGGTVQFTGLYGARYNMFPFGDFFSRNITLRMGLCPAQGYIDTILDLIRQRQFDATDIITHRLPLSQGAHAYAIFDNKEDGCIKVVLKP